MIPEWENGRERLARYERELVAARQGAHPGGTRRLPGRQGRPSTDLLLARRNEIDVRLQAVQLEMETARLWAQLNFLFPDERHGTRMSRRIFAAIPAKEPK